MEKLFFYDINKDYIKYLKLFDSKIPNISYEKRDKFICGVVLNVNSCDYYVPVSSYNKKQRTNFIIKNERGIPISSLRFSFMFPVSEKDLKVKEFNDKDQNYVRFMQQEFRYINLKENFSKIKSIAQDVYITRIKNKNPFYKKICCDFSLLEEKMHEWEKMSELERRQNATSIKNS